MAQIDELRMIARVARLYFEMNKHQSEIAQQLGISQATVSRLLVRSKEEGIIRISLNMPQGVYIELEESLVMKFNLRDAIVVDSLEDDEKLIQRDLGAAAAYFLESSIRPHEVIGISSWSATLLALVDALHPLPRKPGIKVVQILGGVGNPAVEAHATRMTSRLAQLVNGEGVYLPVPGVLTSEEARNILLADDVCKHAISLFDQVSTALVGIGAIDPSPLLAQSGNIFPPSEMELLNKEKAVGDILLHFYDIEGNLVNSGLDKRRRVGSRDF